MDNNYEIAIEAMERTAEKLRRNADIPLGETITKMREEFIKSILISKGYITLSDVLDILAGGWLPDDCEPVMLNFDSADATENGIIIVDFDV